MSDQRSNEPPRSDDDLREETDVFRRLRPDQIDLDDPGDPAVLARAKERFMSAIDQELPEAAKISTPDIYPRLAYNDELAAVEYLTRVFGFEEIREARLEFDEKFLCWLRLGSGIVMLGHANVDVHRIHSPSDVGLTTVIMHVYVHDIDAHYARAMAEEADITMELTDAFYGDRVYEATDLEGHRVPGCRRTARRSASGGPRGRSPRRPDRHRTHR